MRRLLNCFVHNPQHLGQGKRGVNFSPSILSSRFPNIKSYDAFRNSGKKSNIWMKNYKTVMHNCLKSFKLNNELIMGNHCPINLGGDHSISIGTVASSVKMYGDDLKVVWVDAHADLNSIEESKSGNIHGMPVNMLLGIESMLPQWIRDNILKPEQLLYIGLRDLDEYEKEVLKEFNIEYYDMDTINKYGLKDLLGAYEDCSYSKVHLSIDVDGLDPSIIPSTGTPVPGGLSMEELKLIIELYYDKLVNVDIVELNLYEGTKINMEDSLEATENIIKMIL